MLKEILVGSGLALVAFLLWRGLDIVPWLMLGGMAILLRFMIEQRGQGSRFEVAIAGDGGGARTGVTFDDIGGQEIAKRELLEALDFVRNADKTERLGIRPLRGILLGGPPGTGKTLLAKAAASYVDAAFVAASGSQFVEMYAGVGAQRIRRLFKQARELAANQKKGYAILFIDEIDVLGTRRGQHHGHLEYDQTLNELLVQMDGMNLEGEAVRLLLIGATNRLDLLDPALLRPGRFDRTVLVDLPDRKGRLHILRIHCRNRPLDPDVDLESVARETYGFSGAHLESVVNEAAIMALRDGRESIGSEHFQEAIEKVMMGERLDRSPTDEEKERIAYHETGHALLSEIVNPGSVASVTIASRGRALGYMRQMPNHDTYLHTRQDLLDQIAVALAGAVSEEIFLGSRSTGSMGDFDQVIKLAERIIEAGLSDLGIVSPNGLSDRERHEEIQRIIQGQEAFVKKQILALRDRVQSAACRLIEDERLDGDEFRAIIGKLAALPPVEDASTLGA